MAQRKSKDPSKRTGKSKQMRPRKKLPPVEDPSTPSPSLQIQAQLEELIGFASQQVKPVVLLLDRATLINEVTFRSIAGDSPQSGRYVGPVGVSERDGNKFSVTALWSDGHFVYIQSDKYAPKAVPCSNVLDVEPVAPRQPEDVYTYRVADEVEAMIVGAGHDQATRLEIPEEQYAAMLAEQSGDDPPDVDDVAEDHALGLSEASAGAPPQEVAATIADPDQALPYTVVDPSEFLPNDTIIPWLQGELQDRPPGEYLVLNFNFETSMVRLQSADLSLHPIKVPESLL